ncbi:hypothetical protein QEZ54_24935 [Catellatospora sp. KI3]|nr:hypothetical protein [Catellatospora sp. KI3]MDI1464226.1 hypothetical protein [Catellatospora sp. KI3]
MIETLQKMLFEPRYPVRYVGRHRMAAQPFSLPQLSISLRRSRSTAA